MPSVVLRKLWRESPDYPEKCLRLFPFKNNISTKKNRPLFLGTDKHAQVTIISGCSMLKHGRDRGPCLRRCGVKAHPTKAYMYTVVAPASTLLILSSLIPRWLRLYHRRLFLPLADHGPKNLRVLDCIPCSLKIV